MFQSINDYAEVTSILFTICVVISLSLNMTQVFSTAFQKTLSLVLYSITMALLFVTLTDVYDLNTIISKTPRSSIGIIAMLTVWLFITRQYRVYDYNRYLATTKVNNSIGLLNTRYTLMAVVQVYWKYSAAILLWAWVSYIKHSYFWIIPIGIPFIYIPITLYQFNKIMVRNNGNTTVTIYDYYKKVHLYNAIVDVFAVLGIILISR